MSKETRKDEIVIKRSDIGIELTTIQTTTTQELFHSPEDALNHKNSEAHIKKSFGYVLIVISVPAFMGSAMGIGDGLSDGERLQTFAAVAVAYSSGLMAYAGVKMYENGMLARKQWDKLRELLNQASQSVAEQSEPTASESS